MRVVFTLMCLAVIQFVVATALMPEAESTVKLRAVANVSPPPRNDERRLGFFDWLFKSPTVAPDTPATASNNNNEVNFNEPWYDSDGAIL